MASTVAARVTPTEDNSSVDSCPLGAPPTSPDKPVGRMCLVDVLNQSGIPRKVFAHAVLGRDDEAQFSKMLAGTRPFDVDDLELVPRAQLVEWLRRFCAALGLTVPRELELAELNDDLLVQLERVAQLVKLVRVRRAVPAKAMMR